MSTCQIILAGSLLNISICRELRGVGSASRGFRTTELLVAVGEVGFDVVLTLVVVTKSLFVGKQPL